MTVCAVDGCHNENDIREIGGVTLCAWHRKRWGDFFDGYGAGHYGDDKSVRRGRLHKGRWEKAMSAFLDTCANEIAACCYLAEIYAEHKSHAAQIASKRLHRGKAV